MADERPKRWRVFQAMKPTLYAYTIEHARNLAKVAFPVGAVTIDELDSGEEWKRERGEWRQTHLARQPELRLGAAPEDGA